MTQGLLNDTQYNFFEENGYINGGQLISAEEADQLCEEVERILRDKDRTDIPQPLRTVNLSESSGTGQVIWQIVNTWMGSEPFKDVMSRPVLGETIAQMLDAKEVRLWHDQIQYKPKSTGGTNMWHQDWPYWPILSEPHQVTAWLALDDVDEENGCMSMVPGSHKWGNANHVFHKMEDFHDLPESYEGNAVKAVSCPVKKGHVHFHHGLTWHGSPANKSGRPRRAIAFHYMGERTCFVEERGHLCKSLVEVKNGEKITGEYFPLIYEAKSALV